MKRRNKYLLQKIELMEMKVKEAKERELDIERLHNTMIKAFKDSDSSSKQSSFVKELEYLSDLHMKEMRETVKSYEEKIGHLTEKNLELLDRTESLTASCDSMQKEIKRLLSENSALDKQLLIVKKDQETEERIRNERLSMKSTQERENAEFLAKHENKKIAEVYAQKEGQWKQALEQATKELEKVRHESLKEKGYNMNCTISFEKQIAELSKELQMVRIDNDDLKKSVAHYQKEIEMLKNAPVQYMNLADDEEDLLRLIKDNENYERLLDQKDKRLRDIETKYKTLLNKEKKKLVNSKEQMIDFRDKFDLKKNELMQEMLEKDEHILRLTTELRSLKLNNRSYSAVKSDLVTQSTATPFRENISNLRNSCQAELENLTTTEYKLLRICQNMVDSTSRMECSK